ncbi:MAG: hypothetical protein ACFFKA_01920, partial [Candidatus Thorarchaeota archaeon]
MKSKNEKVNRLIVLAIVSIVFLVIETNQAWLQNNQIFDTLNENIAQDSPLEVQSGQISTNIGGYNSPNVADFDTLENSSSLIYQRDYLADENNYFNITTPENWNVSSMEFDLNPYSKEQVIEDTYFDHEYYGLGKYWNTEELERG